MMARFLVLNGNMDPLPSSRQLIRKNVEVVPPLTKLSGSVHAPCIKESSPVVILL